MVKLYKAATLGVQRVLLTVSAVVMALGVTVVFGPPSPVRAAACAPSQSYGQVAGSVTLPEAGTYRIWTRMKVPSLTNKSYMLEIGGNCYTVAGRNPIVNDWAWTNYKNGDPNARVDVALPKGAVSYKLIGNAPGVKVDRLVFTTDLQCAPARDGTNCNNPNDTISPTVDLTAPVAGARLSGTTTVRATASDNVGVTKVELFANSVRLKADTVAPYDVAWDTTTVANGTYLMTAKAFDAAGNVSSDTASVTVQNSGDSEAPTTPSSLSTTAVEYNKVTLKWDASTDNVGVTAYTVWRNGAPIATVNGTTYTNSGVLPNTTYSYQVQAADAGSNKSAPTAPLSVKTPAAAGDTTPPTVPTAVEADSPNSTQVNLSWAASTDNTGVAGYDVYQASSSGNTKIATVSTTSFGHTSLTPSTEYSYYVVAKDSAGNLSGKSATAKATTRNSSATGVIRGKVTDASTGSTISGVSVTISDDDHFHYAKSGSTGVYRDSLLFAGPHSLTFRKDGYASKTITLHLTEGQVLTGQNVTLQKQ